jgi:hypothetical protein
MSNRLTNDRRLQIRTALLDIKFKPRREAVQKRRMRLAEDVYDIAFGEPMIRRMNRLPDGWLKTSTSFGARLGKLDFHQDTKVGRRFPSATGMYSIVALDAHHKLSVEFANIVAEENSLHEESAELQNKIDAVLRAAATDNKLYEIWPELKSVSLPALPKPVQLPAVRVDTLNTILGLKKAS